MELREIHIDGFGIFCDNHITGLSSGLNVIYGPNEFGKSTLLEFVRRILFGFRASSATNPYPALSGGAYGGRIVCQLASGNMVTISRKQGRSGGPVDIITDSDELSGQEALHKIIGQISEGFYKNVYAIGLDELQLLKTLEEEEIKDHIYGAGLELGNISLTDVQGTFRKQAEKIFKPGGSAQYIPALYKEIRDIEKEIVEGRKQLSRYDEVVKERDGLQAQIELLDVQISKLEQEERQLQAQKKMFPTYVKLKEAEADLAVIAETPEFTKDSISKLDKLEANVSNLERQARSEASELQDLETMRDSQIFDSKIIDLEPEIISLQKQSERFKSALQDINGVKSDIERLCNSIRIKIEKLGSGWTGETVRNFNLSHSDEDRIHTAREQIEDAKRKIENIRSKLDAHLDSKASEESRGAGLPPLLRNTGYVGIVLGATGFALGFALSQPAVSIFSACLFVIGMILAISARRPNPSSLPTPLEKKYGDDLSSTESHYGKVLHAWQEHLRTIGFEESLSPDGALEVIRTIKEIQREQDSLAGLESRNKAMQEAIDMVNRPLDHIFASTGRTKPGDDATANIEILVQQLDNAKSIRSKREGYEEKIERQQQKIDRFQEDLKEAKRQLKEYVDSFNVADEADFRLKYQVFHEREELKKAVDSYRTTIQSVVGMGEHYNKFLTSISATEPPVIDSSLEIQEKRLEESRGARDEVKEKIGELRVKIDDLSAKDLAEKQTQLEVKKQQLRDHSADWVRAQIALYALEQAVSKYENTRQPEVIKAATEVFDRITGHAYPNIIKPTGSDELVIQDQAAKRKNIKEMSRGTREQLYFAMRLGLIEVYESKSEPMPVIMDDILVNFDDDRGPAAIDGLMEFSQDRQVIVLTCHRNTLDIYKRLGARHVEIE